MSDLNKKGVDHIYVHKILIYCTFTFTFSIVVAVIKATIYDSNANLIFANIHQLSQTQA